MVHSATIALGNIGMIFSLFKNLKKNPIYKKKIGLGVDL